MPIENPFSKKVTTENVRILPSDVRYAFQYKEAKLGISEMRDLIDNDFPQEALYVILKGASENPQQQLQLIQHLLDTLRSEDGDAERMRPFLHAALSTLEKEVTVEAQKLALISRVGFEAWHRMYADTARALASEDAAVFLLAHATFVGLVPFIEQFQEAHKPLHVLVPDFFEDTNHPMCGYVIQDGVVAFLPKDFSRPETAVIVDDVRHTGATAHRVNDFWLHETNAQAPAFKALYEAGS